MVLRPTGFQFCAGPLLAVAVEGLRPAMPISGRSAGQEFLDAPGIKEREGRRQSSVSRARAMVATARSRTALCRASGCRCRPVQRNERCLAQPAVPLDGKHGLMADAVDRKEHAVGPANEFGQQADILHLAAIMMQERAPERLNQMTDAWDLAGFPPT